MPTRNQPTSQVAEDHRSCDFESGNVDEVVKFKKRMLKWANPVEYVNNMYGCHPGDDDNEYFKVVFGR